MRRDVDSLTADEAARDGAVLLDVREPEEFDAGHAPGARCVPLGEIAGRIDELRGAPVICVCRTGSRSGFAADALIAAGMDAANLEGGMLAWAAEGLPVTSSSGGAGVIV